MIEAQSIRFEMTPFVWNTDAAVFVFKDGKAILHRENLVPGRQVKVVLIGDTPSDAQLEAVRNIWQAVKEKFEFAVASFCDAIEPKITEIVAA